MNSVVGKLRRCRGRDSQRFLLFFLSSARGRAKLCCMLATPTPTLLPSAGGSGQVVVLASGRSDGLVFMPYPNSSLDERFEKSISGTTILAGSAVLYSNPLLFMQMARERKADF